MRRNGRSVLLLAVAASGCSSDWMRSNEPEIAPEVRVPLRFERGLPLVEATLPNDERAWFVIDTGAGSFTLLDEKLSSRLRLKHDLVRDPLMPSISLSAVLPKLEVDGMGRRDLTIYVSEELAARPEFAGLGVPVEGVLGTGYFKDHCLWLDWGRGEFTATRPRVRLARHVALPLRVGHGGELHTSVRVNGIEAQALVDTASPRTLVTQELADKVLLAYDRDKHVRQETSIGAAEVHDATLPRLSLGTEEIANAPVLVIERRLPSADLVLGTDVLSRYGVILDLSEPTYLILDPLEGAAKSK